MQEDRDGMSFEPQPVSFRVDIRDWRDIPSADWLLIRSAYAHLLQCIKTISSDYEIVSD